MPKGYPINPEKTRLLRSIAQKNRVWTKEHLMKVRRILIKRNKSQEHISKVKKALLGHGFSEETLKKMRENHRDTHGENNPNWRGDKVGKIGIHIWLRNNFNKKRVCEICGFKSNNPLRIDWSLIHGRKYERKRENFRELCRSCHAKYDKKGSHFRKC